MSVVCTPAGAVCSGTSRKHRASHDRMSPACAGGSERRRRGAARERRTEKLPTTASRLSGAPASSTCATTLRCSDSAGMLCRDPLFQKFLCQAGQTFSESEEEARQWMLDEFQIASRAELKNNPEAARQYMAVQQEYLAWKQSV